MRQSRANGDEESRSGALTSSRSAPDSNEISLLQEYGKHAGEGHTQPSHALQGHKDLLNLSACARGRRVHGHGEQRLPGKQTNNRIVTSIGYGSRRSRQSSEITDFSSRCKFDKSTNRGIWENGAISVGIEVEEVAARIPRQRRKHAIPKPVKPAGYFSIFSRLRNSEKQKKLAKKTSKLSNKHLAEGNDIQKQATPTDFGNPLVYFASGDGTTFPERQKPENGRNQKRYQLGFTEEDGNPTGSTLNPSQARFKKDKTLFRTKTKTKIAEVQSEAQEQAFR